MCQADGSAKEPRFNLHAHGGQAQAIASKTRNIRLAVTSMHKKVRSAPMRFAPKEEEKQPETTNLTKNFFRQRPGQTRRDSVRAAVPKESQT